MHFRASTLNVLDYYTLLNDIYKSIRMKCHKDSSLGFIPNKDKFKVIR